MTPLRISPGVIEGQTLRGDLSVSVDVCVIGSGPGGASAASVLSAAGQQVLILEEGGYFTDSRFRMREEDAYTNLYQDGGQRATKDLAVNIYQGKAVGGGTVVNWAVYFDLPDEVLGHWRKHHAVGEIDSAELVSVNKRIGKRLNVQKVPLGQINRNNRVLYDGCETLGYQVDTVRRSVVGCAEFGACGLGCPINAKQSTLVSLLPDAMDRGATIISRCRVERLEHVGGEVKAVTARFFNASGRQASGATLRVTAKRFVLAAGAINSPAILLRSGAPDASGMTGKRTFLHPVCAVVGDFKESVHGYRGAPSSVASHQFSDRGAEVGFIFEAVPMNPGLISTNVPGFGASHRNIMRRLPYLTAHIALTTDGFHDDVPGGQVVVKPNGDAVLDYTLAPPTIRALREGQKELIRLNLAMGATKVFSLHEAAKPFSDERDLSALDELPYGAGQLFVGSAHQMGGCMMSDEPSKGVVRSVDLRHHSLKNLHVLDGSVFPTSLGVNPQGSIFGIATLVAERLAAGFS